MLLALSTQIVHQGCPAALMDNLSLAYQIAHWVSKSNLLNKVSLNDVIIRQITDGATHLVTQKLPAGPYGAL